MMKEKKEVQTMQSKIDKMFYFVKTKGKYVICVGGYQVCSKKFDTTEQCEQYIASKPWSLIINICYLILKKNDYENKNENPQDK